MTAEEASESCLLTQVIRKILLMCSLLRHGNQHGTVQVILEQNRTQVRSGSEQDAGQVEAGGQHDGGDVGDCQPTNEQHRTTYT